MEELRIREWTPTHPHPPSPFGVPPLDEVGCDPWEHVGLTRTERARLNGARSICLTDGQRHIQLTSPNHVERGPERQQQLSRLQERLDAGYQLVG